MKIYELYCNQRVNMMGHEEGYLGTFLDIRELTLYADLLHLPQGYSIVEHQIKENVYG